jgi:hypothetical protein
MAIGSEAPIGEEFKSFKIKNGMIDKADYDAWAEWFGNMVAEHGLLFGEAKVIKHKKKNSSPEEETHGE